jgi:hypothetical protein
VDRLGRRRGVDLADAQHSLPCSRLFAPSSVSRGTSAGTYE